MALIQWTSDPSCVPGSYVQADYATLHARFIAPARDAGPQRTTLDPPAAPLLRWLQDQSAVAVTGVRVDARSLADVYGYLAEPAYRRGVAMIIVADRDLEAISDQQAADTQVGYPWSRQRLAYLCSRDAPPARWPPAQPSRRLDESQLAAVSAHDGVVQIIAPAGSGKTTVLIARAGELVARGVAPRRILCTTFNKDAQMEMQARLHAAGLGDVRAQTLHGVGFAVLRHCGGLRSGGLRSLSLGQWRRLCAMASNAGPDNEWIEPPLAPGMVSAIKLGLLVTPEEHVPHASADATSRTAAEIYRLYEAHLAEQNVNDFDDLIFLALRRLQRDGGLRERWQERYEHVLVDEYQDIDPAQETLVQILAAPQDGLFVVGDEDQTLYAWRSASVERIIGLDGLYPGLERVALNHNYRCPPEVVTCSRRVIETNRHRFPKTILAADSRLVADDPRPVIHQAYPSPEQAAADVARKLSASQRDQIVVLARTSRLLRMCAVECVPLDVKISAPENVFEPAGARAVMEAYCRLLGGLEGARHEDVATVFRHPGRGLPFGAEEPLAQMLAAGSSFAEATGRLPEMADRARRRLGEGARILDAAVRLAAHAPRCIGFLRDQGGLDKHFREYEDVTGGVEKVEIEVLEDAVRKSAALSMAQYAIELTGQSDALRDIRDDDHGIELTTVHRAKGRQWPTVIVFGCDEEQLPHRRALEALDAGVGDALEAERRVAYVAFTRAQQRLVVLTTVGKASRFCVEAGLVEAPRATPGPAPGLERQPRPRSTTRQPQGRRPTPAAGPATGYDIARAAIRRPEAQAEQILHACRSVATAQHVLAAAIRSADAPCVEMLTAGQAVALLQELARSRSESLQLTVPDPQTVIAELEGSARRATADALRPRRT